MTSSLSNQDTNLSTALVNWSFDNVDESVVIDIRLGTSADAIELAGEIGERRASLAASLQFLKYPFVLPRQDYSPFSMQLWVICSIYW